MYSQNIGANKIASHLNSLGYKTTTGRTWYDKGIRDIIKNKTYCGYIVWNKVERKKSSSRVRSIDEQIEVKGKHEPIISEELWNKCKEIMNKRFIPPTFAATLIHDPELIILDEPFSGLDPVNAEALRAIIGELIERKKYIVMSSHQMATVEEYCEDLVLLHRGKTVLSGSLRSIKASYGHNRLLGSTDERIENIAKETGLALKEKRADACEYAICGKADADRFLAKLIENNVYPTRYELREPSLNEIFIEKAGSEA